MLEGLMRQFWRNAPVAALAGALSLVAGDGAWACQGGTVIFANKFQDDTGGWDDAEKLIAQKLISFGKSGLLIRLPDNMDSASLKELNAVHFIKDADICLDGLLPTGTPEVTSSFGIVFGAQDYSNFFAYQVFSSGVVGLFRLIDDRWNEIFLQESTAIKRDPGASNLLRLTVKGGLASMYVNGAKVRDIRVQVPAAESRFGIYVQRNKAANDQVFVLKSMQIMGTDEPAFSGNGPIQPQTIGSWQVHGSQATLIDAAVVVPSAPLGHESKGENARASLELHYTLSGPAGPADPFWGSTLQVVIPGLKSGQNPPGNTPAGIMADGKLVYRFNANIIEEGVIHLTNLFGNDLAGLEAIQTLQVFVSAGGHDVIIFQANLRETATALKTMRAIVQAVAQANAPIPRGSGDFHQTFGSWDIYAGGGGWADVAPTKAAVVTDSAPLGGNAALKPSWGELELRYNSVGFSLSHFTAEINVSPDHKHDALLRILADGKEIDRASSDQFNSYSRVERALSTYFGGDLKGLASVRNIKAIVTMDGADTTIYEVNLTGTYFILERMVYVAQMTAAVPTHHRRKAPPGAPPFGASPFGAPPSAADDPRGN